MTAPSRRVLAINSGSSSLKAAAYELGPAEARVLSVEASRIGLPGSRLRVVGGDERVVDGPQDLPDHETALQALFRQLDREHPALRPDVVGHRVVHGGGRHWAPELVVPELMVSLEQLARIDPEHLPQAIAAIRAVEQAYPGVPQVACFDTGFHQGLPAVARRYALPRDLAEAGVVRYGFHGLSYEYVLQELRQIDEPAAGGRVVIAHLGNGASMAALQEGRSIDTTMGFSPTGGLVMGTRCGDLDPSVIIYLLRERGMTVDAISRLINRQAGLLGVSGTSGDMRDLLAREASDSRAADAVTLFCYQAKKYLGASAAAIGGLDLLVFTAGIGERAAPVRERICAGLDFLGIELDGERNRRHGPVISSERSQVTVRVIRTNEELMVARYASRVVPGAGPPA